VDIPRIAVLGSTGSIGTQTLDILRRNPGLYTINALSAGKNVELLLKQAEEFRPELLVVGDEQGVAVLRQKLGYKPKILVGTDGLVAAASSPHIDLVMLAVLGSVGLVPCMAAARSGKHIALANKESLAIAGEFLLAEAAKSGSKIIPVDSEHSSLYQCLLGRDRRDVVRVTITASGGPFFRKPIGKLESVTPQQAAAHPRWSMGQKISIDSATLINKALEVIEAAVLFGFDASKVDAIIHPETIIHGLVDYNDGTTLAALFNPDMRVPITYALRSIHRTLTGEAESAIPPLSSGVPLCNLLKDSTLSFHSIDPQQFPAIDLAKKVLDWGLPARCALNAADEVAVGRFVAGEIRFTEIIPLVARAAEAFKAEKVGSIEEVLKLDKAAREYASNINTF
jgi:1-deoxy-D-xylulose-5-phosphate reductoisomerase